MIVKIFDTENVKRRRILTEKTIYCKNFDFVLSQLYKANQKISACLLICKFYFIGYCY